MKYRALTFWNDVPLFPKISPYSYKWCILNNHARYCNRKPWWFVSDLVWRDKNKKRHKQIIINVYKYWWDRSNWNNTNCNIYHLPFIMVTASTYRSPHTVREQLKEDKKNRRFSNRGQWSVLCQWHAQGIFIKLGQTGYCTGSTYSLEYRSDTNRKPISLSTIGLNLKSLCS